MTTKRTTPIDPPSAGRCGVTMLACNDSGTPTTSSRARRDPPDSRPYCSVAGMGKMGDSTTWSHDGEGKRCRS